MYFCKGDGELFLFELMMRQVPGFRPRRNGIHVQKQDVSIDQVFEKDRKEEMKLRMEMYEVPKRIRKDAEEREADDEFYRDAAHKGRFLKELNGPCAKKMRESGKFLAAVFLLSSDEWLWDQVRDSVTDAGIFYDNMLLKGASVDQYILFHAAKEIYTGVPFVSMEEMADSTIVSDELLALIVSAYLLRVVGLNLEGRKRKNGKGCL